MRKSLTRYLYRRPQRGEARPTGSVWKDAKGIPGGDSIEDVGAVVYRKTHELSIH